MNDVAVAMIPVHKRWTIAFVMLLRLNDTEPELFYIIGNHTNTAQSHIA